MYKGSIHTQCSSNVSPILPTQLHLSPNHSSCCRTGKHFLLSVQLAMCRVWTSDHLGVSMRNIFLYKDNALFLRRIIAFLSYICAIYLKNESVKDVGFGVSSRFITGFIWPMFLRLTHLRRCMLPLWQSTYTNIGEDWEPTVFKTVCQVQMGQ